MVADGGLILKSLVQKASFGPVEHQYPYFFAIFWSRKRGGQLLWVPMRESDPDGHLNSMGSFLAAIDWLWLWRVDATRLPRILPHR